MEALTEQRDGVPQGVGELLMGGVEQVGGALAGHDVDRDPVVHPVGGDVQLVVGRVVSGFGATVDDAPDQHPVFL